MLENMGRFMHLAAFAVRGEFTEQRCKEITQDIIKAIDMHEAYFPMTYRYPLEGMGGEGFTYFQPITESFIVWDVYARIGAYLMICSCKSFSLEKLIKTLESTVGISQVCIKEMSLC